MGGNEGGGGGGERWNFFGSRSVVQKSPTDPGSDTSPGETFTSMALDFSITHARCYGFILHLDDVNSVEMISPTLIYSPTFQGGMGGGRCACCDLCNYTVAFSTCKLSCLESNLTARWR